MTFQVAVAMAAYYAAALLVLAALWAATDARPPFRLGLVGICALAMLLFVDPFGAIRQDSFQHAGLAGQFRQAISEGDYFPLSVNTAAIIGDQAGMWNGHLLYLAAGYIGLLVGGSAALKLIIIAVFALQCWYVWSACREIGLSDFPALALTAAICVTTYALNNLYVRGAFPEFVATSLVCSAASLLFIAFRRKTFSLANAVALGLICGSLTGIHVITAVYGNINLIALGFFLLAIYGLPAGLIRFSPIGAVIAGIIAAPWIYLIAQFPPGSGVGLGFTRFPGVDELWLRLLPFPFSRIDMSTGQDYFVTQIASVLLLLIIGQCIAAGRSGLDAAKAALIPVLIAMALLAVTISPLADRYFPSQLKVIQFLYRLVTYINLWLFIAALLTFERARPRSSNPIAMVTIAAAVVLPIAGALVQFSNVIPLLHWSKNGYPSFAMPTTTAVEIKQYSYSWGCLYGSGWRKPEHSAKLSWCVTTDADLRFSPGDKTTEVQGITVEGGRTFSTNVVIHPWNVITVDGERCQTCRADGMFVAIALPLGPHRLEYSFRPDAAYDVLDKFSVLTVLLTFMALTTVAIRRPIFG